MRVYSISHPNGFSVLRTAINQCCYSSRKLTPVDNKTYWLIELKPKEAAALQQQGCLVILQEPIKI